MSDNELHENDRRILRELQRDATLSLKALAERIAMSASSVWRRIQDLEAAGIIIGRVTLIDPMKAGLKVCVLIQVNIVEHKTDVREAFELFVANSEEILQCFAITGSHDYALVVRTRSVEDYERFLMNKLLAHPSVASTATQLVLRQHKGTSVLPL